MLEDRIKASWTNDETGIEYENTITSRCPKCWKIHPTYIFTERELIKVICDGDNDLPDITIEGVQ